MTEKNYIIAVENFSPKLYILVKKYSLFQTTVASLRHYSTLKNRCKIVEAYRVFQKYVAFFFPTSLIRG